MTLHELTVIDARPFTLDFWWPQVKGLIEEAVSRSKGEVSADDVLRLLMEEKFQLWLVASVEPWHLYAAAITEVVDYPRFAAIRVVALAGEDMERWKELLDARLQVFARLHGAKYLEAVGRKGFERKLKDLGYEAAYVVYYKEVK